MSTVYAKSRNPRGNPYSPFNKRHQNNTWADYSQKKQEWIKRHPEASSRDIDRAARQIAKALGL